MPKLPSVIGFHSDTTPTTNVLDYLRWRGDLTLAQSEFNEVDNLILCILAYLNLSCASGNTVLTLREAAEAVEALPEDDFMRGPDVIGTQALDLIAAASESRRFCDLKLTGQVDLVDPEEELQFSAVTFLLPDETVFVAIRGTDNTLVGWKEDFNMSFTDGVPAQLHAAEYMKTIMVQTDQPIRIGGHSKGGNLAVWAAAHQISEHKHRILQIYNNDGPGFSEGFLESPEYLDIREKISSFVPESSAVGVMMAHDEYTTIKSSESNVMQHAPFSWIVEGTRFIYSEDRSRTGEAFEKLLANWLHALTPEEREQLVDDMYAIIASSEMKTIRDLDDNKLEVFRKIRRTFKELGREKQMMLLATIQKMLLTGEKKEE